MFAGNGRGSGNGDNHWDNNLELFRGPEEEAIGGNVSLGDYLRGLAADTLARSQQRVNLLCALLIKCLLVRTIHSIHTKKAQGLYTRNSTCQNPKKAGACAYSLPHPLLTDIYAVYNLTGAY